MSARPDTLHVFVAPSRPYVVGFALAPETGAGAPARGLRTGSGGGPLRPGGWWPFVFAGRKRDRAPRRSSHFRKRPVADPGGIVSDGAGVLGALEVRRRRPGEISIPVGTSRHLTAEELSCVTLGDRGGVYHVAFADTVYMTNRKVTSLEPGITVRARTADGAAATGSTCFDTEPRRPSDITTRSAGTNPEEGWEGASRSNPFPVGDMFTAFSDVRRIRDDPNPALLRIDFVVGSHAVGVIESDANPRLDDAWRARVRALVTRLWEMERSILDGAYGVDHCRARN